MWRTSISLLLIGTAVRRQSDNPEVSIMTLESCIKQIQENLRRGTFQNEAAVSQGVVLKILNALGWDTYETQVVAPEYAIGGRRVDYALCHPPTKPSVFIEVKKVGNSDGADKQLFEYAFHEGVPLAVLTDGQEWNFYLPSGQGAYTERRFYFLDLLERDVKEICFRLDRYLSYARIKSGEARNNANNDYQDKSKQQEASSEIPKAWRTLLVETDELLAELLSDKVEESCGYKPTREDIDIFLQSQVPDLLADKRSPSNPPAPTTQAIKIKPVLHNYAQQSLHEIGYQYKGQWHSYINGIDVMLAILREFAQSNKDFLSRFVSRKHGRTRRWVDRSKSNLYPGRTDLQEEFSVELIPGWWVGTNYSATSDMPNIVRAACEVMGIEFGKDLEARFR